MGALAQFPVLWMPEDDLRLKNAIESGASLESLAKGAVQFSRRFTLHEIKERWVSILYDPVISAEVSARWMDNERNSSNLSQKSFRPGGLKDTKCNDKRIKIERVRDHYYAARKRIRYENLRSIEMELASGHIYTSDNNNGMEPPFNYMLGDPTSNQFERQQSDAGLIDYCFPQVKMDGVATSCTGVSAQPFHASHDHCIPENFLIEQGSLPKENPQIFEASLLADCFQVEKLATVEDANMCDVNGAAEHGHSIFDQINNTENLLVEFDGLLPECGVSFDSLDFPSPLREMPMWDTADDISAPMMPVNDNPTSQNHDAGNILALPEGGQALDTCLSDCDAGPANSQNRGGDPRTSDSDEYLAELYDLLDDEIPVMDTDNKPPNDNPMCEGLSSLLLASSFIADGDQNNIMAEPFESLPSDLPQSTTNGANLLVSCVSGPSRAVECQAFPSSDFQMSSLSVPPQSPVQSDFAACILNTEDPLVPNIDDIILPHVSLSVKDLLERRYHCEAASNLARRDHENFGKPKVSSTAQIGLPAAEKSRKLTAVDCKAPNNLPEVGTHASLRSSSLLHDLTKGEHPELAISRGGDHCIDNVARSLETNGLCNNSDNLLGKTPVDLALNGRVAQNPLSKFEDHVEESDDDIPYYSDVEEMVLEMDLDPVDQDIDLKEKVSKYQSNDAKKTIIRLEQAAHSYMQRAIARRGAFAVIYGRNSKHYIKKSEVLLGRGTDDSHVDIDLGAEGRGYKVSRRQAVIKLEADGKFYMKNTGKRSIYKNNMEIATGQTARLQSGNLIEIQRITFIFEDSPICVKRHLRSLQKPAETINALPETS